jgi:transposase
VWVLSVGHGRKSDPDDAVSVAVAAHSDAQLRPVGVEDQATVLHLLTKRGQDLVAARTQTINRLHRLLADLVPGGARRNLTAKRAAALLAAVTPVGQPAVTRWQLATEPWPTCASWSSGSPPSRPASRPPWLRPTPACSGCSGSGWCWRPRSSVRWGCAPVPSKHRFAAHTGTAPLEASSGQVIRHRLSRAGDRKLNHALYMIAMVQVRRPSAGQN